MDFFPNLNADSLLQIMFEVHQQNETIYNNFDITNCKPIYPNNLKKKADEVYLEFKKLNLDRGTVDVNHYFWAERINSAISKALLNNVNNIKILNGCCTKNIVILKDFMNYLYNLLKKKINLKIFYIILYDII